MEGDLAMTNPEDTHQDAELDSEPSTEKDAADVDLVAAGEEGVAADYEERLREFDNVDSVPVVSVPVESSGQLDESDLKVGPPPDQSG